MILTRVNSRLAWSNQKRLHRGSRTCHLFVPNQRGFKEDRGFIDGLGLLCLLASLGETVKREAERNIRGDEVDRSHCGHKARPQYVQTAVASLLCVSHFIARVET